MKNFLLFLMVAFLLMSCNQDRLNMIEVYKELAQKVQGKDYLAIPKYLDAKSINYYNQITDPDKLSIEQVIDLGLEYKVIYFSVVLCRVTKPMEVRYSYG